MQKRTERKFLTSRTLYALLAFAALNVGLQGYGNNKQQAQLTKETVQQSNNEKRQEGDWIWWITRNYLVDGADANLVFMGSSQMGSALYASEAEHLNLAVDTVTHRHSRLAESLLKKKIGVDASAFNLSIGGAMASDQYMIAKSLFNSRHKPKLVVVGVNPRDFIDNSMPSASATDPFRYLSPYADLDNLASSAFSDMFGLLDWQLNQFLPAKAASAEIRAWLPNTAVKLVPAASSHTVTADGEIVSEASVTTPGASEQNKPEGGNVLKAIYGNQGEVRPGEWKVVACSWGAFQDNTQEYAVRYQNSNPAIFPGQKKFFEAFLSYLKQEDIKVLVVGMPSLWPNRALLPEKFWTDFRNYLTATSTEYGASFVDLSGDERFDSKDYLDTVHLNSTGGKRLVQIITDEIARERRLASSISQKSIAGSQDSL